MNLNQLSKNIPWGQRSQFKREVADQLNVSLSLVGHWFNGIRKPSYKQVPKLEAIANNAIARYNIPGLVTRQEIRPDIYNI